jgi:CBS domain containing-hemolysin-like protein
VLELILAVLFTVVVSALCSTIEAMLLSTTAAEVEALKAKHPHAGALLEQSREGLDESISAILTFNTIANTLGAFVCGNLAAHLFPDNEYGFAIGIAVGILVFGEIIPKNVGVIFRVKLTSILVYVLTAMRLGTRPVAWLLRPLINLLLNFAPEAPDATEEIVLLAEKEAKEGNLTVQESNLIANALKLDEIPIRDIMTPRSVVTAIDQTHTMAQVFRELPTIPFARIPVYGGNLDHIVGLARRRDLLKAKAADQDNRLVSELMQPIGFVPEKTDAAHALQLFLKYHQQLAVVQDDHGLTVGVVTMEDIFEHLLGMEIFEKDDVAVDMRELARRRLQRPSRPPLGVSTPAAHTDTAQVAEPVQK